MKKCILLCILLIGCDKKGVNNFLPSPSVPAPTKSANGQFWILAMGQSNMVGQGMKDSPFENTDYIAVNYGTHIGPAVSFAMDYTSEVPSSQVHIIQCAVGGTSMTDWQAGGPLYNQCLDRWKQVGSPAIGVILFMQGEAEGIAGNKDTLAASTWGQHFSTLICNLRRQLGVIDIPVIFGQIGPNISTIGAPDGVYDTWLTVQQQQEQVMISHCAMIKTDDLGLADGWLHFNKDSYRAIGDRMYRAYKNL